MVARASLCAAPAARMLECRQFASAKRHAPSPVALPPRVVILYGEAHNGRTILVHDSFGKFEQESVSGIEGDIDLAAQDEILLCIALIETVHECSAAK